MAAAHPAVVAVPLQTSAVAAIPLPPAAAWQAANLGSRGSPLANQSINPPSSFIEVEQQFSGRGVTL
jgi:hypothetical protein